MVTMFSPRVRLSLAMRLAMLAAAAVAVLTAVVPALAASPAASPLALYRANCAACHGAHLEGGVGPALKSAAIAGQPFAVLDKTISRTMPLSAPGSLSAQQYAALTRFILDQNAGGAAAAR
ncbi:cytochrome c [Sphingomonas koreensis]|nr:cytochrome c [Sphingomonas koreensis]